MKPEVIIDGIRYVPEPDPLAEVKAAWKAGKAIQYRYQGSDWIDWNPTGIADCAPTWSAAVRWQIKPEKKPDVVIDGRAYREDMECTDNNLRLTFDGDTCKLIKAEVL